MQPTTPRPNWTQVSLGRLKWTDITDPSEEDTALLAGLYPFHPLNLQDCLSRRQLPRAEDHEDYVFIITQFPSLTKEGGVHRDQLSVFVGAGYVVSLHPSDLTPVGAMAQGLRSDEGKASSIASAAQLVYRLIDSLVNGLFPLLDKIRDDLDGVEDDVFYGKASAAARINGLRRQIADIRRTALPLRRTLSDASTLLQRYGSKDLSAYFRDVLDHVDKVTEALEQSTETVEIFKDTNFIMSSDKTNRVLTVLTILFTLTLPAALVSAIYGMNVALPLGNGQNPPQFLGTYTSFIVLWVVIAVPTILMTWYFKSRRWF